jgi:hypothetical protein
MSLEKARERWLDAIQPRAVEMTRPFRAEWWLPDRETVPLDDVAKLSTIELQEMLDNYYLCICRLRIRLFDAGVACGADTETYKAERDRSAARGSVRH